LTPSGQVAGVVNTDSSGRYDFKDLSPSNYQLRVNSPGFNTALAQNVPAGGGRQVNRDLTLQVGSVSETVSVNAATVKSMPMNGRNYAGFSAGTGIGGAYGDGIGALQPAMA